MSTSFDGIFLSIELLVQDAELVIAVDDHQSDTIPVLHRLFVGLRHDLHLAVGIADGRIQLLQLHQLLIHLRCLLGGLCCQTADTRSQALLPRDSSHSDLALLICATFLDLIRLPEALIAETRPSRDGLIDSRHPWHSLPHACLLAMRSQQSSIAAAAIHQQGYQSQSARDRAAG